MLSSLLGACSGTNSTEPEPGDAPALVVSLTFDDSWAPQKDAASLLEEQGLHGTFYVNSPRLYDGSARPAASLFLSVEDALALQARGHEIGGHTLSHPALTALPEAERAREVLSDRARLLALGLAARSFAYPFGDVDGSEAAPGGSVLELLRGSGYASARGTDGLGELVGAAVTLPPGEDFRRRSLRSNNAAPRAAPGAPAPPPDTADTLLGWMDQAARCGGGWLPLIFHHLREDCSAPDAPGSYCFEFGELERLVTLLAAGSRCPGAEPCYRVSVQTVSGALGEPELLPPREAFALRNPSFERALASGASECAQDTVGSGGTALLGRSTELWHSGLASERMQIEEPFVAPAEIRISRDLGGCAPFASAGEVYDLALHYRAEPGSSPKLRMLSYWLASDYTWQPWTRSASFSAQTPGQWVRQTLRTEPLPPGTIAFSFGLRLESTGAVNVDDFEASVAPAPVTAALP
jgi:peptidoglycan/xylan/chitin deacetylase (PgdA/CDA1 family)